MRCCTNGAERGHRSQAPCTLQCDYDRKLWILFPVFLHCFASHPGHVLVWHTRCQRYVLRGPSPRLRRRTLPITTRTSHAVTQQMDWHKILMRSLCRLGAQCITVMLRAWAPSYNDIPNHLPASAGITTQGMCSYFLFWIIQLPLLLIHPTKLRPIFIVKLIGAPIAALATMGWCLHKAGGGGEIWKLQATVSGSSYTWLWLSCVSTWQVALNSCHVAAAANLCFCSV